MACPVDHGLELGVRLGRLVPGRLPGACGTCGDGGLDLQPLRGVLLGLDPAVIQPPVDLLDNDPLLVPVADLNDDDVADGRDMTPSDGAILASP